MQSDMWSWLFRRVPAEQHNQVVLMTRSGTEIAVQALLRIEESFLAIKGRLAGSQDAGRVYFIPFNNIDYFGLQRDVKESEFDVLFGTGTLTVATPAAALAPSPSEAPDSEPEPARAPETPVPTSVSQKTPLPLKSEVLERFRSRIAGAPPTLSGAPPRPPDA